MKAAEAHSAATTTAAAAAVVLDDVVTLPTFLPIHVALLSKRADEMQQYSQRRCRRKLGSALAWSEADNADCSGQFHAGERFEHQLQCGVLRITARTGADDRKRDRADVALGHDLHRRT